MNPALSVLILALIQVESGGNDRAIGARGEAGCLQITQAVLDDVNRVQDLVKFTREDCFIRERAIMICEIYLTYWCDPKRLEFTPTLQTYARTWNGGPQGWAKPSTWPYWIKVFAELRKQGVKL